MLIVTRLAYGVHAGHEQFDEYLDQALGEYAIALYAHLSGVREATCMMRSAASQPTTYRSTGLASLTENLERATQRLLDLDREFMRYAER